MPEDLAETLDLQQGVVSLDQAIDCGLTRQAVSRRVVAGRWRRVHPRVYIVRPGPLTFDQRVWAGVLYVGAGAVVGLRSAWWLADRELPEPQAVHIVVPEARVVQRQSGLVIVRTRRFREDDMHPSAMPRRFRLERAVIDCASRAPSHDSAVAMLASSVQRRTTTVPRLRAVLDEYPNLHRRALLRDVLDLAADGAETLLEVRHHQITTSHGLPAPDRQRRLGDAVVDGLYDCPDGSQLVAEFDGKLGHLDADSWWADMGRDNQHTIDKLGVLRFPGFVLLTDPHAVAATIAAALTARGWTGNLRCPRGCPGSVSTIAA